MVSHVRSAPLSATAKRTWVRQTVRPQSAHSSLLVQLHIDLSHPWAQFVFVLLQPNRSLVASRVIR